MSKEITHKSSNSRKNILWRQIPSNRLLAYTKKMIIQNSASLIFYALAKILVDTLDETRQTWTLSFKGQLQHFDKLSLFDTFRHVDNGFDINV